MYQNSYNGLSNVRIFPFRFVSWQSCCLTWRKTKFIESKNPSTSSSGSGPEAGTAQPRSTSHAPETARRSADTRSASFPPSTSSSCSSSAAPIPTLGTSTWTRHYTWQRPLRRSLRNRRSYRRFSNAAFTSTRSTVTGRLSRTSCGPNLCTSWWTWPSSRRCSVSRPRPFKSTPFRTATSFRQRCRTLSTCTEKIPAEMQKLKWVSLRTFFRCGWRKNLVEIC